jgi:hypothetical protein
MGLKRQPLGCALISVIGPVTIIKLVSLKRLFLTFAWRYAYIS